MKELNEIVAEHTVEIALFKQSEAEQKQLLKEILAEVKKTNGRVTKLEGLKAYVVGGITAGGLKLIYEFIKLIHQ